MTLRNKGTGADTVLNFKRAEAVDLHVRLANGTSADSVSSASFPGTVWTKYKYFKATKTGGTSCKFILKGTNSVTLSWNREYSVSDYSSSYSSYQLQIYIGTQNSNKSADLYVYNTSGTY